MQNLTSHALLILSVALAISCVSNKKKTKISRHSQNTKIIKLDSIQKKLDCTPTLIKNWAHNLELDSQEISKNPKFALIRNDRNQNKGILKILKKQKELCQISISNKPEIYLSLEDQSFYILSSSASSAYRITDQRCEFLGLSKIGPYEAAKFQKWKNSTNSICKEYK